MSKRLLSACVLCLFALMGAACSSDGTIDASVEAGVEADADVSAEGGIDRTELPDGFPASLYVPTGQVIRAEADEDGNFNIQVIAGDVDQAALATTVRQAMIDGGWTIDGNSSTSVDAFGGGDAITLIASKQTFHATAIILDAAGGISVAYNVVNVA